MTGTTPRDVSRTVRRALQLTVSCVSRDLLVADVEGAATRIAVTSRLPRRGGRFVTLVVRYRFGVTTDTSRPVTERWQARTLGY